MVSRLIASIFLQLDDIWVYGMDLTPVLSGTAWSMNMKVLQDVNLNEETRRQKKVQITYRVCKSHTTIRKKNILLIVNF